MKKSITILLVLFSILVSFIFLWADYPPHFVYTKCPVIYKNNISMLYSYNETLLTANIGIIQYIINERDDIKKRISYYRNDLKPCTLKTWSSPRYSRIKIDGISYDGDITDSVEISNGVWLYPYSYCEDPILKQEYFNYAYASHTGHVIASIIHFVFTIDSLDKWNIVNPYFTRDSLITLCEESFAEYNNVFYEEGETGRWLWFQDDLSGTEYADIFYPQYPYSHYDSMIPNNKVISPSRGALYLYAATGKEEYLDKMTGAFKHFQSNLFLDVEKDCYYWSYPDDYVPNGGDDISHGGFSVNTITEAYKLIGDNVFDSIDMNRFTNTLLKTIVDDTLKVDTLHNGFFFYKFVDGYHPNDIYIKTDNYTFAKAVMYRYLELSIINPLVYEVIHNLNPSCTDLRYFKHLYNPLDVGYTFVYPYPGEMAIDISIKSLVNYNLKQDTVIIRIYDPSDINLYYYEEKYILSEGDSIYGELFPEPPKETNTLIIEAIMLRKDIIEVLAEADTITVPKVLEVDCPEDVPVLTYFNYEVFVYEEEIIYPLTNAHVILTNSMSDPSDFGYIYEEGYTGTDGKVSFNIYAENTKDLAVIVDKDGYRETVKESKPYMWSYSENATGSNNGNNIIRNTDTGELLLTYYQYNPYPDPFVPTRINRVIEGYSDNEGEWWYVWDKAYGQNPSITITKTATGEPIDGIFYDNSVGYIYDNATLPSPVTVSNGSMWVEPGSMWNDNITNRLHSSGIKYIDEGTPDPYLIHAKFAYDDPENAIVKVILKPIGEIAGNDPSYLVIPGHNPSIALKFNYLSNLNDRIIAFEDKNSEICLKWYNSWKAEWIDPERKSFSENIKSINPHIDAYGDKVSLVWEEEIATGTDEYRISLDNSRFFGDNTETDKKYPKVKRSSYISFVEDNNAVNIWYYKDNYSKKINLTSSGQDISYPDFEVKTRLVRPFITEHTVYYMFTEKDGDIYKIKTGKEIFTTNDLIQPLFDMVLMDTIEDVFNSPLEDYVQASQRPIERLSSTVKGFDENRYYELIVKTTNNNKNTPYVLLIDGQEEAVIYEKESEITVHVSTAYILDNELIVSLDRVKGNPNRTIDIKLYEYDEKAEEETIGTANTMLKPFKPSENITPFSVVNKGIKTGNYQLEVNVPNNSVVKIGIYDIMGREVNCITKELIKGKNELNIQKTDKHNNELSKGVYFIKIETDNNNYTGKLINLK